MVLLACMAVSVRPSSFEFRFLLRSPSIYCQPLTHSPLDSTVDLPQFGTQDWIEAGVIFALVVLNVSVGFFQEWKAEKTVAALASVGSPTATVIRHGPDQKGGSDGQTITIEVEDVVP